MLIPPSKLIPTEVVGGSIAIYKDVWPNVSSTITLFEKIVKLDEQEPVEQNRFFQPATVKPDNTGSLISQERTNSHMSLSHAGTRNEQIRLVNNYFSDIMMSALWSYTEQFSIREKILENESLVVLRYQTGEEYKAHYDGGTQTKRSVSVILYLNDDYEGGEIEFVNFGIKIKPEAGTFLIFPSGYAYRHIAHPVTSGTKYAIVTWLHDQP